MSTPRISLVNKFLNNYWFLLVLIAVTIAPMIDRHEWTVGAGRWLKGHHGPDMVIFSIFILSGMTIDGRLLRKGLGDLRATIAALTVVFIFSPMVVILFSLFSMNIQIITGLFLVAVVPSTLSSGVVMTEAAGGNSAHALFVTILANTLAVFTIPLTLGLLLLLVGDAQIITMDKSGIMRKIALLVLVPLALGMGLQIASRTLIAPLQKKAAFINQLLVLTIVWMGMCQSRDAILAGGSAIVPITAVAAGFHLLLVLSAIAATRVLAIGPGRRESVIFMGGQKTLPLSVILQVTLFPGYGLALVVCVVHHVVHLIMDAYLVGKLKAR